jgi:hypothetical protein
MTVCTARIPMTNCTVSLLTMPRWDFRTTPGPGGTRRWTRIDRWAGGAPTRHRWSPPGSAEPDQVHYLIAQEKAGHVSRLILVYRQKVPERTVIQMAWDLRDYPPAWPAE